MEQVSDQSLKGQRVAKKWKDVAKSYTLKGS
jgi:hypothetical protein